MNTANPAQRRARSGPSEEEAAACENSGVRRSGALRPARGWGRRGSRRPPTDGRPPTTAARAAARGAVPGPACLAPPRPHLGVHVSRQSLRNWSESPWLLRWFTIMATSCGSPAPAPAPQPRPRPGQSLGQAAAAAAAAAAAGGGGAGGGGCGCPGW